MLLRPQAEYCVSVETARVAKAVFPNGNIYLTLADSLGAFLLEQDFAHLFLYRGQPAVSPFRLALATIMQYVEGLTDRQTADAVRSRIDWKYVLCLELTDSGFDHTVLSEFRTRLINGQAESLIFEKLFRAMPRQRMAQSADSPTQRRSPCSSSDSRHDPSRVCWGNTTCGAQYISGRCSRMVALK